jgi:DNA-binding SARP family transcriptional activator
MEDHLPVLRVFLLGPFRVELVQPDGETRVLEDFEALLGRDLSAILFKLILIYPERRVKRDVLVRTLWPGQSLTSVRHSLEVTKSKLGRTLEDLCERSLLPRAIGNPPVYAIAPQTEIWTDLEACLLAHSQALSTTDPPCSLGYWEEVYAFMQRGELLADDTTAYWYKSSLVQDRRTKLIQVRRQCVLRIADLALECGDINRALEVLTQECEADPVNEDLVFHVMNVLARLERYPEALAQYTQLEAALLKRGAEPREETKRLTLWLRAQGVTKYFSSWSSPRLPPEYPAYEIVPPFSQPVTDIIKVSVSTPEVQNGASGLAAQDSDHSLTQQPAWTHQERMYVSLSIEEVTLLLSIVKGDDLMSFDSSKRETLRSIAALVLAASHSSTTGSYTLGDPEPWERLSRAQQSSSPSTVLNTATLEYFEDLLRISWQLCDQNQFATASGVLVSFLPLLVSLPKQESRTAFLASNGLHLQSILAHHHLRLGDKVSICEQSVDYARQAGDVNTLITTLVQLAVAYEFTGQPEKEWAPLQEALNQSQEASPLVQSRLYSEYSLVLASSGRVREAEFYRGLALEVFPDDPAKDPAFAFANSNIFIYSCCAGLVCIHAGRIPQAFSAFEHYKQHPSGLVIPERLRLEIANGQSRAAILDNDAERYAGLLEDVLIGSGRIRSQKRFDEALGIFQEEMPASWLLVDGIRQLAEQYGLKREK